MANTFDSIDLVEEAQFFFLNAAAEATEHVDAGLAWRNYGRFLYRKGSYRAAQSAYELAINEFRGSDDRMHFYRSSTYIRWAESEYYERIERVPERVRILVERARLEANSLENERRRKTELQNIKSAASKLEIELGELEPGEAAAAVARQDLPHLGKWESDTALEAAVRKRSLRLG